VVKNRLNELLKERGRTLYWLSMKSGVRYATVWKLSRGEVGRLNLDALDRICEVLDCQPGDLLVREAKTKSRKRGK
jgi:putative transcriptional regulator